MNNIKGIFAIIGIVSTILIGYIAINGYTPEEVTNPLSKAIASALPQIVKPPKLDKTLTFAGESIPVNIDTRERMEKELLVNSYYHSSTVLILKNAKRYFPVIESILTQEGVPLDLKYLCVAESSLSNAVSPSGAKGFWQFMSGAANDYGLEVNGEVDERYHLEKSTRAAAKYLSYLKNKFGTWANAAAAYNMGMGALQKNITAQGENSYFDLNLNAETSRYVFRLVALKELMENPTNFGFYLDPEDYYQPWDVYEVEVTSSIPDLGAFARQNGLSYRLLKYYNPWLIDGKLTVHNNTYYIKIPKKI